MTDGKVSAVGLDVLPKLWGVYLGKLVDLNFGVAFLEIGLKVLVNYISR